MTTVLVLMLIQGVLGAFDTLYHHELTEALARRPHARLELRLHAVRAAFYGFLFAALGWSRWQGAWAVVLAAVVLLEVGLTLWDFVEEDRSRALPATERALHTILAINGGAVFGLLATQGWWQLPTAIVFVDHGWLSAGMTVLAVGVTVSGLRDALASRQTHLQLSPSESGPPRRWLITGGTGFIGSRLVAHLLAADHAVTVISRRPRVVALLYQGRVQAVSAASQLGPAAGFDVIVNLAGASIMQGRWSPGRQAALRGSRIDSTTAVLQWLDGHRQPGAVFISASAVGIYGTAPQLPCTEQHAAGDGFAAALCRDWEAASSHASALGLRRVILRLGLVLGRSGGIWPLLSLPARFGLGAVVGHGAQPMPWVHVDDVLRAIFTAAQQSAYQGVYNVVAPEPVSQGQFVRAVARHCRRPVLLCLPALLVRGLLGERASLLLEGQPVVPQRLVQAGFVFRYPGLNSTLPHLLDSAQVEEVTP